MDWGFIKPKYIHYADRWEINWLSLSLNKKIMITPQEVWHTNIICIFGYGVVFKFKAKYNRP